jgi:ESX secretion system protein EccD
VDVRVPGGLDVAAGDLRVSVHGAAGVLDLVVPAGASAADVAREYAEQSGLAAAPALHTRLGAPLAPDARLADAGVVPGELLVAAAPGSPLERAAAVPLGRPRRADEPGPLSGLWCATAAAVAGLAGWCGAQAGPGALHDVTVWLLGAAAGLGVLPLGRRATHRVLVAPVFAASAAFAVAWDPQPARLPTVVGIAALAAAVAAAVARALDRRHEEALRVWVACGLALFVLTGACALLGLPGRAPWALLLVAALLAARFVPALAVDVPDQYLLDLERLAVTAWSARDRLPGRRGRTVVPRAAVEQVAAVGARLVTAYAVAVLVVATVSAPLLLASAPLPIDRVGARCLVLCCGAGLLLAARSYRHAAARLLLRGAGLACWCALLGALVPGLDGRPGGLVSGVAVALATGVVAAAVATGRGWRSAWWSRRAEVAEALCGAAAVASVLVATGVLRSLWESIHLEV